MNQELLTEIFPHILEVAPMATPGDDGPISAKLNNSMAFIGVLGPDPDLTLPQNIRREEFWFVITFTCIYTPKIKPKHLKVFQEIITNGAGTDFKVQKVDGDFFQLDVLHRLPASAVMANPDLIKEIFLEMAEYAENLSRTAQRLLSVISPVETIKYFESQPSE